jgi:hypothetical protein
MVLLTPCICNSPFNCTTDHKFIPFFRICNHLFPTMGLLFFFLSVHILSPYFTTGLTNTLCNLNMYSWTSPLGCETLRVPHYLDSQLTDGGKVVSHTQQPSFTPQEDSWYSFLL